jgi:hypothetical protein
MYFTVTLKVKLPEPQLADGGFWVTSFSITSYVSGADIWNESVPPVSAIFTPVSVQAEDYKRPRATMLEIRAQEN